MAGIPLPRRGLRSLLVLALLGWISLKLFRRIFYPSYELMDLEEYAYGTKPKNQKYGYGDDDGEPDLRGIGRGRIGNDIGIGERGGGIGGVGGGVGVGGGMKAGAVGGVGKEKGRRNLNGGKKGSGADDEGIGGVVKKPIKKNNNGKKGKGKARMEDDDDDGTFDEDSLLRDSTDGQYPLNQPFNDLDSIDTNGNVKGKGKGKVNAGSSGGKGGKGGVKKVLKKFNTGKKLPDHNYLENGLVMVNPKGQHPIYDLIERGQALWQSKLDKASRTLGQAVDEYRRRYGRAPPKGFDRWWEYAQQNNVQLPDEYDQIHKDLDPFHALHPSSLQKLVSEVSQKEGMYTIYCPGQTLPEKDRTCVYEIVKKGTHDPGFKIAQERAEGQMDLLKSIEGVLEEVEAVFYSEDVPWQFVGHEYKGALEDAAALGEYLDPEEHDLDWAHLGWASACAPHKPLRKSYDINKLPILDELWGDSKKSFIWNHQAAMDPCIHPTMTHMQGFLASHGKGPGPSKELYPVMAMCKTPLHSDVLGVAMEAWTEDVLDDPEWDVKKENKLLWRGKNTGIYYKKGVPWEISQRINLVQKTSQATGSLPLLSDLTPGKPIGPPSNSPLNNLNKNLMDIAFVDEPIQCDPSECKKIKKEYRYGARKDWAEANQYKYMLDLDGNGWSARFKRLMSTNSAILKSTIFPEWYSDRIQPWVHYIPVKPDLTDLYDITSFFINGHDELGKEIAGEGKKWSKTFWRKEDMTSYQFRLFLELSRLMSNDRDAASFQYKGSELD